MLIGYARVSTIHQNLDPQFGALRAERKKGVKRGRPPKLTGHQIIGARRDLAAGRSYCDIAEDLNVHHSTISGLSV